MSAKKLLLAAFFLAISAWVADAILKSFFSRDEDFQRAAQIIREDAQFQAIFGVDAVLEPAKKTVVNKATAAESYVQLDFRARSASGSSSSPITIRIYGNGDADPRYEVKFH